MLVLCLDIDVDTADSCFTIAESKEQSGQRNKSKDEPHEAKMQGRHIQSGHAFTQCCSVASAATLQVHKQQNLVIAFIFSCIYLPYLEGETTASNSCVL